MNFKQILASNIIDEWKDYYISYDMLLAALKLNNHLDLDKHNNYNKYNVQDISVDNDKDNHLSTMIKLKTMKTIINLEQKSNDIHLYHHDEDDDDDDDDLKRMSDIEDDNDSLSSNTMTNTLSLNKLKTLFVLNQKIDDIFKSMLHFEAKKINAFYLYIEQRLIKEYQLIAQNLSNQTISAPFVIKMSDRKINNNNNDNDDDLKAINLNLNKSGYLEPLNIPKLANSYRTRSKKANPIYLIQIKKNIFMLYQRFLVLSNFSRLNYMGFKSLINEFNKIHETDSDEQESKDMFELMNNFEFVEFDKCTQCMNGLISLYSNIYEDGDIARGKVRLFNSISWHNIKNKLLNNDTNIFWFGSKFGVMLGLLFWSISTLLLLFNNEESDDLPSDVKYIYRGCGLITLFLWLWSICVYIWSSTRITFIYIFEINPRSALSFIEYFDMATSISIMYFLNVILFIQTFKWFGHSYCIILPCSLFIFYILRLILPIFAHWRSRKLLLNTLGQCLIAPFGRVAFRDMIFADVLTSFSYQFVDFYMSGCILIFNKYYSPLQSMHSVCKESSFSKVIKVILICIPYWIRFMQKLNGYYNAHHGHKKEKAFGALKYGLGLSVKLIGEFNKGLIWIFLTIIATIYFIFWDVKMDWNLFPWSKRNKLYPVYLYYIGLFLEILIRSLWVFTLFPGNEDWKYFPWPLEINGFIIFANVAEIFRRAMWSIFRIYWQRRGI